MEVRPLTGDEWQLKRDLRLAALEDSPAAFASTHAREARRSEADWRTWPAGGAYFAAFGPPPVPAYDHAAAGAPQGAPLPSTRPPSTRPPVSAALSVPPSLGVPPSSLLPAPAGLSVPPSSLVPGPAGLRGPLRLRLPVSAGLSGPSSSLPPASAGLGGASPSPCRVPLGVAGAWVAASTPGVTHLIGMWVTPAARGHRIAALLADAVTDWARDRGHDTVELELACGNTAARNAYLRCGFTPTGQDPFTAGGTVLVRPVKP